MGTTASDDRHARLGCRQVRRTLQAFLDGEVEPVRAELVAAHLESCSRCQVEADVLTRVIASLRRLRPDIDLTAYTRLVEATERLTEHDRP
ncbi:MAG: zf-HC2 domain-containing protein [Nitriliruptoraceae bacterium]